MANYERIYEPVVRRQLIKCIHWCQNVLNLRDWDIEFYIGRREKQELAAGWSVINEVDEWLLHAEIWSDLEYAKEKNENPYVAICHEMLHILIGGKCHIDSNDDEHITYCLDDVLYEKFCKDNHIKKMPYKER